MTSGKFKLHYEPNRCHIESPPRISNKFIEYAELVTSQI